MNEFKIVIGVDGNQVYAGIGDQPTGIYGFGDTLSEALLQLSYEVAFQEELQRRKFHTDDKSVIWGIESINKEAKNAKP